jgi:hypothetical protein
MLRDQVRRFTGEIKEEVKKVYDCFLDEDLAEHTDNVEDLMRSTEEKNKT